MPSNSKLNTLTSLIYNLKMSSYKDEKDQGLSHRSLAMLLDCDRTQVV